MPLKLFQIKYGLYFSSGAGTEEKWYASHCIIFLFKWFSSNKIDLLFQQALTESTKSLREREAGKSLAVLKPIYLVFFLLNDAISILENCAPVKTLQCLDAIVSQKNTMTKNAVKPPSMCASVLQN